MIRYAYLAVSIAILLGLANYAFSQSAPPGPPPGQGFSEPPQSLPFDQRKQIMLQRIGQENAILQQMAGCVQAAADHEALRQCSEQRRAAEQAVRHQMR